MSILEVENIKKHFDKSEILKGISFSLEKGEILSIIGSSGSGKTTLLRCLTFLEKADEGIIRVNGQTIFNSKSEEKRSVSEQRSAQLNFGLVFQNFNLFRSIMSLKMLRWQKNCLQKNGRITEKTERQLLSKLSRRAKSL